MTTQEQAELIAKEADETLNDGINFREIIRRVALEQLNAAYQRGYNKGLDTGERYPRREDMGR